MMRIGITGGIGSGKSYVCNLLRQRGIPVYNCDEEAKRLMVESAAIRQQLSQLIGEDAYINNVLNKPAVARFLFANADNAARINRIVHPVVKQDFLRWAASQPADIVVQESAILFESGFHTTVDKTIEVFAPKAIRLKRAMQRDCATRRQIEARMAQQMDERKKRQLADFIIRNDGIHDLPSQIDAILYKMKNQLKNSKYD